MKLVLADYIAALKEDQELDSFFANLLRELDIIPLTVPQRGRQHGVDIAAVGPDFENSTNTETLFLFVIKQGNLTRSNWNTGVNAVRPTLDEIIDSYLPSSVPDRYATIPKKIIVVTNGSMSQNMIRDWSGYTHNHSNSSRSYDFWGIDKLILLAERAQFSESLFPKDVQSLLRKSLALMDLSEYDYRHFYSLLDRLLELPAPGFSISKKEAIKKIRLINSCQSIVLYWAQGYNNLKPALIISERILLSIWRWIEKNGYAHDGEIVREYFTVLRSKTEIEIKYFVKIKDAVLVEEGLAFTGQLEHTEYCLLTYEQIGFLSIMGLTQLWHAEVKMYQDDELFEEGKSHFRDAEIVADYLAQLIKNNPSSLYPKFDEHCIEINLALILLYETGRFGPAITWLNSLINYLSLNQKLFGFFPLWITDYEKLAEHYDKKDSPGPESSILLTTLAEWSLILKQYDGYSSIRYISLNQVVGVNLQLWKPSKETEEFLYTQNAMHNSGTSKVSIKLPENYRVYQMEMAEEQATWNEEEGISCIEKGSFIIAYIAFRHFRTYVFPLFWRRLLNSRFCFNKTLPSQP